MSRGMQWREGAGRIAAGQAGAALIGAMAVQIGATAAHASSTNADFTYCDGRPEVTAKADGLTATDMGGVLVSKVQVGTTEVTNMPLSAGGVAACDRALADPALLPDFWMRRVNLLQGRAMHHLTAGDAPAALKDLEAAEAVAKDREPQALYQRSLGLSIELLRAFIYRNTGRRAEGEALALKVVASRPYSSSVIRSALVVVGPNGDRKALDTLWRALAKVEPTALTLLYLTAYDEGRFDDAMAMREQLTPVLANDLGMDLTKAELEAARNHRVEGLFRLERTGERAYMLAARGQAEAARAELAEGRRWLAESQPVSASKKLFSDKPGAPGAASVSLNERLKADGAEALDRWAAMVDMRVDVAQGHAEVAARRFDTNAVLPSGATVELMRAMASALPAGQKPPLDPDRLAKALAERRVTGWGTTLTALRANLPDAEDLPTLPRYKAITGFNWDWQRSATGGFTAEPGTPEDTGGRIRFQSRVASKAEVREMALLRAADMARRLHKAVVVRTAVDRRKVWVMDRGDREEAGGWESEIDVAFVDPANLPEKYRGASWRVMDADALYAALKPTYPTRE